MEPYAPAVLGAREIEPEEMTWLEQGIYGDS
jgi:hypothetical protein